MDKKIKNYLGIVLVGSALIIAVSCAVFVKVYYKSINPSSLRSFTVSAEGKVVAVPDVARFDFTVIQEGGNDIASLQKQGDEKMNSAVEFVKSQGVEDKDIKTESYNLTPRYQYYNCRSGVCPPPEIVGYTITQTASVKVRDFGKIGSLLSGVIKKGANSVSSLYFEIDDSDVVKSEARDMAILKAKEKAKAIAKSAGFRVGRLISIQEGSISPAPVYRSAVAEGLGISSDNASTPAIEAGSQEVTISVFLTYEIK